MCGRPRRHPGPGHGLGLLLGHRTGNPASCGVAVRAGFAAEGIERAELRYGGVRCDVERHDRLAGDGVNFD
ncbi:hypothetical protein ACIRPN_14765 [Streptomyces sp. NPDC101230]|uniref:hypothetical protein n=1 Tax=unclassified Streptomyces TaxID=2593676 RepID=UPI003803E8BF